MSNPYEDFLSGGDAEEKRQAARAVARASVSSGLQPDAAAKQTQIARRYAVNPQTVADAPDVFEEQEAARSIGDIAIRALSTASWASQSAHNAAIARDDLENLADIENAIAVRAPRKSIWQRFSDLGSGLAAGGAQPQGAKPARGAGGINVGKIGEGVRQIRDEFSARNSGAALGAGLYDVNTSVLGTVGALGNRFGSAGLGLLAPLAPFAPALGAYSQEAAEELAPTEGGNFTQGFNQGLRSLPTMGLALAGGAITGSAKAASILTGTLTGGQSYITAKRAGLNEDKATSFATVDALIEAGTELPVFNKLLGGAGESFVERFINSTITEVPAEIAATLGQGFNQWAMIDRENGKTFGEFVAEQPDAIQQTIVASIIGSGVANTAISAAQAAGAGIERRMAASRADEDALRLETLTKFRDASKVAARDVGSFEDFVRTAAEESETGFTDVYVDAQQFAETFDQSELSPEEIGQLTGLDPDEIAQAVATGGDLRIPIEIFAGRLAAEDIGKQLIPHLRIDPDGMSQTEAQTFMQGAQEEFTAAATEQFDRIVQTDEERASGTRVLDNIAAQLDATKRFTPAINRGYAALHAAFATTMGRKLGMTAEAFNQRYGLQVQSGETAAPTFDQQTDPFDDISGLLGRGDWSIMTAENPDAVQLSPEENAQRLEALREDLRAMGLKFREVKGKYGNEENSLAISGITRQQAVELGVKYGQESVLTRDGLVYQDGSVNPATGVSEVGAEQEDFYSTLENGTRFAVDINFDERVQAATFDQSATIRYGDETLEKYGLSPGGKYSTRQVAAALEARQRDLYGLIDRKDRSPETAEKIANWMVEEALFEFNKPGKSGSGWYSVKFQRALDTLGERFPELLTDKDARSVMTALIAVASDGATVTANLNAAVEFYGNYRESGRFTTTRGNARQAEGGNIGKLQALFDERGVAAATEFLLTEDTITNLKKLAKAEGVEFNAAHPANARLPLAAVVFGPKLGSFYANLMGADGYLTMDRWWSRTFNRYRGQLIVSATRKGLDRFKELMGDPGMSDEGVLAAIVPYRNSYKDKGYKNGSEIETAANTLYKAAFENIEDAPWNASDRGFMITATEKALEKLAEQGHPTSAADLQAVLWYYEKRLYGELGARQTADVSYEDVARKLVDQTNRSERSNFESTDPHSAEEAAGEVSAVYNQGGVAHVNPLDLFRRESLYPERAVQHDDGAVYVEEEGLFPDRLAKIAEQLGVPSITAVEAGDPRLATGAPLWHTEPVIDSNGNMVLDHWGPAGIAETDPARWGESGTAPRGEQGRIGTALPRTFFGIASGQPGGYVIEFPGRTRYTARVPADRVYDIARDPDRLKKGDGVGPLERRIKDAGYAGYWSNNEQLGLVATIFEPVPVQTHQPAAYFQDQVFYSALGRAVEQTKTTKAPAAQWIATLKKTPGVKQEELEWSGLLDFLNMQDGPVTRDQLLELLMNGGIKVDEVLLGRTDEEKLADYGFSRDDPDFEENEDADGILSEGETQFQSWSSDPQNDTYRELLITLPIGDGGNPDRAPSTHWDTEAVVAHARFAEKTDADGKRVLFIEEVQSDWHQKGRDQGYSREADPAVVEAARNAANAAEEKKFEALRVWEREFIALMNTLPVEDQVQIEWSSADPARAMRDMRLAVASGGRNFTAEDFAAVTVAFRDASFATLQYREAQTAYVRARDPQGIPNAPFKSTWPALVMKRMIRWAVDHGYERVAWTTGAQQSERYSLSQSVGRLYHDGMQDGEGHRIGMFGSAASQLSENGMGQIVERDGEYSILRMSESQMREALGNDLAGQLIEGGQGTKLDGEDLRVGGEGMKAFYDRNLVNITNDLIKKHGARVGKVAIHADEGMFRHPTDPAFREQPGFDITPQLAEAASNGFPLFQNNGAPRGQVAFAPDITAQPSVITLLRGADLSTFIHESGHFFFEVMTDIAGRADAPAEIVNDVRTLLNHTGVESLTKWQDMTTGQRRQHHEEIARLFEAYIFEGTSPSSEMKSLFDKMKEWMKNVYRSLSALNVNLTPEVSGVFDRMLASDQEISEAQADQGLAPFFKDKPEGMTDTEWAQYQAQGLEATQDAAGALERRSLRDMRYAGRAAARELKRLQREVSDRRAVVREEVSDELGSSPVYRAMRYLRTGKVDDGEPSGEPHKLYTPEVRELLRLGEDPMPDALSGMTSTENGINPAQVADLFGFTSADHMIRDLLFASPFKDAVEAETDQRMRERYGELSDADQLEAAVQGAIHNEVRGRFVATELAAMQNAVGKRRVMNEAAKRMAKQMIDRIKLRNLRPGQFEAAERRAAKAALKAGAGNLAEAATHKRNQLLQFHAAKAAREAVDEADKARDYLRKFGNKNTRAAIDKSFLDQIDKVLEQFELRQTSDRESDRRQELAKWIESMREQGFEPMIDPDTLRVLGRQPFRDLTVAEMRDVVDSIKNIEFLGRQTQKMLTAIDKANLDQAAAEVVQSITDNAARIVPEIIGGKTWWERVKSNVDDFFAMHRKFANVVFVMDGNRYGGPVWERFVRAMNKAGDTETRMNGEASERLSALFQRLRGENLHTRRYIPELNASLRLEDMIAIGLNWGNSANRQRLMDGEKWTPEQVDVILGQLTAKHWDFIEAAWREIDSYWPQIKAKQERVTGVAPEKVEAEPFQVEIDGELRLISGGYYPIKYDPDRSSKAEADTQAEVLRQITGGLYANASTRRGHTKARAEKVERAVRKDFGVIFEHTAQVIHDLAWHETLIDMNRLLKHKGVDAAIRQHYGPETLRWMRKSLEDIAVGDLPAQNGMERGLNYIRSGASIAGLGWNFWTSLLQPIGLTQSWSRIGAKYVGRGIADLFGSPAQMNAKVEWVYSVSPFMRRRGDTMQREINEIRNQVSEKGPLAKTVNRVVPEAITDAIGGSFFVLIAKAQLVADLPTWLGQYNKSLEAGEPEDRAVALADQAVIDSQGSGMIKDLAGVQKGGAWQKLWTNFYSYFSATYNLMTDRTQQLRRIGPTDLPMYAVDVALLTFVPATLTSLMYSVLKGSEDDDEEDIAKKVAADNINYMLGTMLGLREVGGAISGMAGYTGPAGARAFVELGKLGKQVSQGEVDEALLRSVNMAGGVLLHYPAGQVDRTVRGLQAWADGKGNAASPLVGPPAKN